MTDCKCHPFNFKETQQDFAWDCLPTYTKRLVITVYSQLSEEYQKLDKNCSTSTYMLGKVEMLSNLFGNNNITGLNNKKRGVTSLIKDFIDDQCNHFNFTEFEPMFNIGDIVKVIDDDIIYKITKIYYDESIYSYRYVGDNVSDSYNEDMLTLVEDQYIIDNYNKQPELLKKYEEFKNSLSTSNNPQQSDMVAIDYLDNTLHVDDIVIIMEKHLDDIKYGKIVEIHDDNLITVYTAIPEKILMNASACKLCKNTKYAPEIGNLYTNDYDKVIDYSGYVIHVGNTAYTIHEDNYIGIIDSINIDAKTVSINGNNYGIGVIYIKDEHINPKMYTSDDSADYIHSTDIADMKESANVYYVDTNEYLGTVHDIDTVNNLIIVQSDSTNYLVAYHIGDVYTVIKTLKPNENVFECGNNVLITEGLYKGKTGIITEYNTIESMVKVDNIFIKKPNKFLIKTDIQPCNLESAEKTNKVNEIIEEYNACDEFETGDYVEITQDSFIGEKGRIYTINAIAKVALVEICPDTPDGRINMVCIPFSNLKLINRDHNIESEFEQIVNKLHDNTPSVKEEVVECNPENYVKCCADDPVFGITTPKCTSDRIHDRSETQKFAREGYECTDDNSEVETDYDEQTMFTTFVRTFINKLKGS